MTTATPSIDAASLQGTLHACAIGQLAPNMALMRMIALADTREALEGALAAEQQRSLPPSAAERIATAAALWRATPGAWHVVREVLCAADHGARAGTVQEWAARFDAAA